MLVPNSIIKGNVHFPTHISGFLKHLHVDFGQFIVLRGYEHLPYGYINDLDIFIPIERVSEFFFSISKYNGTYCDLQIVVSRLGLIKCTLILDKDIILLDILYGFFYVGLSYQDTKLLVFNSSIHKSGLFHIPSLSCEIRISLLKEILHNSRVREDKASYFLMMLPSCRRNIPVKYFNSCNIDSIENAISKGNYFFYYMSILIRIKLFIHNFKTEPFNTIKNIYLFFYIKYISKNKFHENIFLK